MPASHQKKIQHLYLRAAFGATPQEIDGALGRSVDDSVNALFDAAVQANDLDFIRYPLRRDSERGATGPGILKMILKSRRELEDLNIVWINRMAGGRAALRERMTLFWHGHFATSVPFGYLMQVQNNTLRRRALGKFGDLLHAVARDPAMILYLNNQQNKKGAPNENFAREVMELFTLGEGHYTEKDVKEAARCFTGWTVNRKGEFTFRPDEHDDGIKEFMGRSGRMGGEDVLNILLSEKRTAEFIATKVYRAFVGGQPDPGRITRLADVFYESDYDIAFLMKYLFLSEWFYDEANIGNRICSPVEFIVRLKRLVDLQFDDDTALLKLQRALGQVLFFPPNVAGWPGGKAWIDNASLMLRMSLSPALMHKGKVSFRPKPAFEDRPSDEPGDDGHALYSDWSLFTSRYASTAGQDLQAALTDCLIQCASRRIRPMADMGLPARGDTPEERIVQTAAYLMALPEFQLV